MGSKFSWRGRGSVAGKKNIHHNNHREPVRAMAHFEPRSPAIEFDGRAGEQVGVQVVGVQVDKQGGKVKLNG